MVNEFTFGKIFNGIGYYEANDSQVQRANMGNPPSFDNFATDPLFTNDSGKRWLAGTGPLNFANYVPTVAYGDSAGRTETAPSTNPCWNGCPYTNQADSWTFADNLTKVVGKHNLKAGVYVERTFKVQDGSQGSYLGSYSFGNDASGQNPLDTQDGFANAWLGNYRQYAEGQKNIGDWKFWQTEFYVQDSWRVSPRLTLDLGLRFYGMPPITNVGTGRNASAEFVASAYNPNQVERLYVGECVNPSYQCGDFDRQRSLPQHRNNQGLRSRDRYLCHFVVNRNVRSEFGGQLSVRGDSVPGYGRCRNRSAASAGLVHRAVPFSGGPFRLRLGRVRQRQDGHSRRYRPIPEPAQLQPNREPDFVSAHSSKSEPVLRKHHEYLVGRSVARRNFAG